MIYDVRIINYDARIIKMHLNYLLTIIFYYNIYYYTTYYYNILNILNFQHVLKLDN